MVPGAISRRLHLMSFRDRLVLLTASAVAIAVVLASGIVYLVVRGELRGQVDDQLKEFVTHISPPRELTVPSGENLLILPPARSGRARGTRRSSVPMAP